MPRTQLPPGALGWIPRLGGVCRLTSPCSTRFSPQGRSTTPPSRHWPGSIAAVPAFELSLARTAWFGHKVLWLHPEPDEPFRTLTEQVWRRFPQCPPYEGGHTLVVPHLTIGDDAPLPDLERAESSVAAALPLRTRVTRAQLICGSFEPNSWRTINEFPLG
jgi:2'-5' RNA ligase